MFIFKLEDYALAYLFMIINSQEDQSQFEKIYFTYKRLIYHTAYKVLNNKKGAEDAVYNAFVKIAENISTHFKNWRTDVSKINIYIRYIL